MKKIDIIAGARPNFMKIAPLFKASKKIDKDLLNFELRLIHTGQHYDKSMSEAFFSDLDIPKPDFNFNVGSGSHAEQTAKIMIEYERLLNTDSPYLCIVVGDVNSTIACAIAAKKQKILVGHIEAGLRSDDLSMPEEINRIVTDSISDYFFTTTKEAGDTLIHSGIKEENIFFVGNTMIDSLQSNLSNFKKPSLYDDLSLEDGKYLLLTLHRPANVDEEIELERILDSIASASNDMPIVFPVHPRTQTILNGKDVNYSSIKFIPPQSYLEFMYLLKNSSAVITDSGGITEESTILNIPCMTIRDNTERPETVKIGTNELIGTDHRKFAPWFEKLFKSQWKNGTAPEKWDGKAGERIVKILQKLTS
ncbi:UDP-N-acetylglucosamine 2-epimerase (non-hydrolyzing) [Gammaproteobacteria bacterium]|nr:UDP-N-acetylglucosamine 2-epimerase (non-hydrolyzing) [Gammaproteobacteria bacterium]